VWLLNWGQSLLNGHSDESQYNRHSIVTVDSALGNNGFKATIQLEQRYSSSPQLWQNITCQFCHWLINWHPESHHTVLDLSFPSHSGQGLSWPAYKGAWKSICEATTSFSLHHFFKRHFHFTLLFKRCRNTSVEANGNELHCGYVNIYQKDYW